MEYLPEDNFKKYIRERSLRFEINNVIKYDIIQRAWFIKVKLKFVMKEYYFFFFEIYCYTFIDIIILLLRMLFLKNQIKKEL